MHLALQVVTVETREGQYTSHRTPSSSTHKSIYSTQKFKQNQHQINKNLNILARTKKKLLSNLV
jgi:hypothetical protein